MKRLLSLILSITLLLSTVTGLSFNAYALDSSGSCGENVTYTFDESTGTLTISGTGDMENYAYDASPFYNNSDIKSVTIGKGVTSIGDDVFYKCTGLTSVTISDSVTSIGSYAFSCTGLTSVTIPNGVTSIGDSAFEECTGLTNVEIPDRVTSVGDNAFYNCTGLTSVNISSIEAWCNISFVGTNSNPLYYAKRLYLNGNLVTTITVPNSVTSIGSYAFYNCESLTSITIPNSVTSIGSNVFYNCTSLSSITIPDSVTSIGSYAFHKTAYYNNEDNWENDVLYIGNYLVGVKNSISGDCTIKDGTKIIADYALSWSSITSVTIPDSVTSIGDSAFSACSKLTSITIGNGVTSIGENAFYSCLKLANVTIGNGITSIGAGAFNGCRRLKTVNISSIEDWCNISFAGGTSNPLYNAHSLYINDNPVTDLIIPNSITSIGNYAFIYCTGLTSITIPNSVTSIGDSAFRGCTGLTSVAIPDSVTRIGDDVFSGCTGLTSVVIPSSVTSIGTNPFKSCSGLESITVSEGNTKYDSRNNCNAIIETSTNTLIIGCVNTVIPSNVTSIGDSAFYSCTGITSITIPDGVTSIGNSAFSSCTGLTNVTVFNDVTSIGAGAFSGCSSLADVYYVGSEAEWNAITIGSNNDLLSNAVIHYDYVPDYIKTDSCGDNVTYVLNTQTGVLTISGTGDMADYRSSWIPINNTTSPFKEFSSEIKSIIINDGVTSIGDYAFVGCAGLDVTIPKSLVSIGESAFSSYSGTMNVYYNGSRGKWNRIDIGSGNSALNNAVIHFASESGKCGDNVTYALDAETGVLTISGTGDITDYEEQESPFYADYSIKQIVINDGVTGIGNNTFRSCSGVTSVAMPDGLEKIGNYAFYSCSALTGLTLPNGLKSIGDNAFYYCKGITDLALPDSLTSIGNYAFYVCTGLTSVTIPKGVRSIGVNPFKECKLTGISVSGENTAFDSRGNCNAIMKTSTNELVCGCSNTVIPDDTEIIGDYALYVCRGLTNAALPDTLKRIGNYAFGHCTGLTSVTIPESVKSLGQSAFFGCSGLTNVIIGRGVESIGSFAFLGCSELKDIYYTGTEEQWNAIEISADNTQITETATIHYNYHEHDYQAVVTPVTCTRDGYTTYTCTICGDTYTDAVISALGHDYIVEETTATCTTGGHTKYTCSRCGDTYTDNEVEALGHNYNIVVTAPTCMEGGYTTYTCSRCGDTYTGEEKDALGHDFRAVVTPPSEEQGYTTYTCSRCGESYVSDYTAPVIFTGSCGTNVRYSLDTTTGVLTISGSGPMENYTSEDSPFFSNSDVYKVVIEDGVTSIGECIFDACANLKSVSIPNSVTSIGVAAFMRCKGLTSITIPNSVTSIGFKAFCYCGLQRVTIPNSITKLERGTFGVCESLVSVTIPETVTRIGEELFYRCTSLKDIYYSGGEDDWNAISIDSNNAELFGATIHYSYAHEHNYTAYVTSPTCTSGGYTLYSCSICGDSYTGNDTAPLGHDYRDVVTAPTCVQSGYTTHTCSRCGDKYIDSTTPARGHTEGVLAAVAPTCTMSGKTEGVKCIMCEAVLTPQDIIPALGHDYQSVVTAPTCAQGGYTTYTCSRCGDSYVSDYVLQTDEHSMTSSVTRPATCAATGVRTYTCSVCGYSYTEGIPMLEHNYVKYVIAPTCADRGYTMYTCEVCGDSYIDDYVDKTGEHTWDSGRITRLANCTETGVMEYACDVCHTTRSEEIPALGHVPEESVTLAKPNMNGSIVTRCITCNAELSSVTIYCPKTVTLTPAKFVYDGKEKKPSVKVTDSSGKVIPASNYKITYPSGSKAVGRYAVKVDFKGNYSGSMTKTFDIVPKATKLKSVKTPKKKSIAIKWSKVAGVTGYEVQVSTSKSFKKKVNSYTASSKYTAGNINKLKGNTKYYIRMRTFRTVKYGGKEVKLYSDWCKAKSIKTKK